MLLTILSSIVLMTTIIPNCTLLLAQDRRVKNTANTLRPKIFIPEGGEGIVSFQVTETTPTSLFNNGLNSNLAVINLAWVRIQRAADFVSDIVRQLEDPSTQRGTRVVMFKLDLPDEERDDFGLEHFYEAMQVGVIRIANNFFLVKQDVLDAVAESSKS